MGDLCLPKRIEQKIDLVIYMCADVTNSWLDNKLPLAGLWLFLVQVILSKERIQTTFSSLFQGKWNLGCCQPSLFEDLIYQQLNYTHLQEST